MEGVPLEKNQGEGWGYFEASQLYPWMDKK